MASKNQAYIDQYAQYAMEQMRRYGIPASVTLAQGILESANGQSRLAQEGNNHFGIKATKEWIDSGGRYGLHSDDKPNEKFCYYDDVGQSYEHHSKFLKENGRYAACFKLAADDYKGWCMGLGKAGYATSGKYGNSLISTIERLDLHKYDEMVMQQLQKEGKSIGAGEAMVVSSAYSFPVKRDEFMLVTSPFGMRMHPTEHVRKMHEGIDISTNHDNLLATENNGKVVAASFDGNGGGNYVKVEYNRDDGSKTVATYCHLSSIDVKKGDIVNAGQKIGVSGSTGNSTSDHLHFSITQVAADGSSRKIDPASYLAEIAQKGNLQTSVLHNGEDMLAKYMVENPLETEQADLAQQDLTKEDLTPDAWMKKLLSSEDSGIGMPHDDPVINLVMTAFTGLFALAVQIDNKNREDAMQLATDAALCKHIDLTPLFPNMKSCTLSVGENGVSILSYDNGNGKASHELSASELNRLSSIINNDSYDAESKQRLIGSMINGISFSQQASLNYEQIAAQQQGQQQTIQR